MKLRVDYWIMTVATIGWHCMFPCAEEIKPTVTPIESHMGLYFDKIGQIFFLPNPMESCKLCESQTNSVTLETG